MSIFGIQIGILQKATVLQVIATHFWGISLKKWHINLRNNSGNCGHANRIADNFNGVTEASTELLFVRMNLYLLRNYYMY